MAKCSYRDTLVEYNSLNILLAIKHFHPDLGLRRLFPEHIFKIEENQRGMVRRGTCSRKDLIKIMCYLVFSRSNCK